MFGWAHGIGFIALCVLIWIAILRHEAPYTLLAATLDAGRPAGKRGRHLGDRAQAWVAGNGASEGADGQGRQSADEPWYRGLARATQAKRGLQAPKKMAGRGCGRQGVHTARAHACAWVAREGMPTRSPPEAGLAGGEP